MTDRDCRTCGVTLTTENARTSRGRWVGACRQCEATKSNGVVVRLTPALKQQIEVAAAERGMSMSRLAQAAIEDFLPRLIPIDEFRLTRPADEPDDQ